MTWPLALAKETEMSVCQWDSPYVWIRFTSMKQVGSECTSLSSWSCNHGRISSAGTGGARILKEQFT